MSRIRATDRANWSKKMTHLRNQKGQKVARTLIAFTYKSGTPVALKKDEKQRNLKQKRFKQIKEAGK